ncbi:MAG: hypothetical protein LBC68_07520 [Prevotellaceae bacterium]|jgi:hypothetical protein|nr:hypothetical protein [Prevotellaceae bacterium]
MNTIKKIIVMSGFLLVCISAIAQKNLNIENIFENYGKKEGSVLIELTKDVLGNYTKINRYKSMIIPFDAEIADICANAVKTDIEDGIIIMESTKKGKIETAYYCLKKNDNNSDYEYILFTKKNKKITLIYLRGDFKPHKLESELNILKNLFITINNKQIKL